MASSYSIGYRSMTRRHLLVAGIAISGSVLVACSQQSTPAPTTAPAQPTTASAQATTAPAPAAATTAPAQPTTAPAQATTAPAQAAAPSATPQPAAQAAAPSSGQKTLKFSSYSFSTFEDAMKKMLSSWDPSVTVQTEFAGGSDYWNKVQVEIASGTTPDLGIGEFNRIVSYAKDGAIMALDDYIRTDKFSLDPYVPSGIDQYRWKKGDFDSGGTGGQMFGLPGDAQPYIFVYNKTMFDEAKVAYPTDDWTWDDVVTAGKQITKADQNKWGAYAPTLGQFNEGEWVLSAGGRILSADNKTSGLDTPETMSAYKWAWDLMYTHKIAPKPVPNEATNPFASGRVAMNWDGVWQVEEFAKIKEFQWDMVMHPKNPKTGKRVMSLQSDGWWIFTAAKQKDLAWSLMKFLVSTNGEKQFADLDYFIPGSIPETAKQWYSQKPPDHRSKALDAALASGAKVADTYYNSAKIQGGYGPILQKAWFDGDDINARLKDAAQVMNQQLTQAWQSFQQ